METRAEGRTMSGQAVVRYGLRPSAYFVVYDDRAARRKLALAMAGGDERLVDDDSCARYRDAETYAEAQMIAASVQADGAAARVFERTDVLDLTPADDAGDRRVWEFVEREVLEPDRA